ncbi:aldehyde dehydrogenase family protein [Sphingomonas bacterium]|uniref:aldehyde dehydrogenase family protein n=1 Tax=Sphingomonas bacterium TaxID=1895847 RepID=UPI001C2D4887|nr:aldehyde dehydrogenase family protein [Sphingomonas bacterium]
MFQQVVNGALLATGFEDVIDPSTAAAFQRSPVATADELDSAVAAARAAQPGWAALDWNSRAEHLTQLADAIDREIGWIAALQSMEQGMPYSQSLAFTQYMAARVRLLATFRVPDRVLVDDDTRRVVECWHPLGVVAAIAPWNGPLMLGMVKVASALIGGNTIVLKPSELTPLSTLEIARLGIGILPDGVFNAVAGGRLVGAAMVAHSGFDKISFTGSTATGIAIAKQSAAFLRPMTLELGGNDAAILLPDGSIDDLVAAAAQTGFSNCGQFCAAIKRIYAPAALVEEVGAKLAAVADGFVIGSAFEPGVTLGPIQNKAQYDKVRAIVADSLVAGGRVLSGGTPLDRPGYFFPPTVIADLTDGARLVDEEQFGPVIPVVGYDAVQDVVDRVNAGPYGLTASIWTTDLARGEAIAAQLAVGSAAINRHAAFDPQIPFPLIKQSGMGVDYADHGIKGAMRMQAVTTIKPQRA